MTTAPTAIVKDPTAIQRGRCNREPKYPRTRSTGIPDSSYRAILIAVSELLRLNLVSQDEMEVPTRPFTRRDSPKAATQKTNRNTTGLFIHCIWLGEQSRYPKRPAVFASSYTGSWAFPFTFLFESVMPSTTETNTNKTCMYFALQRQKGSICLLLTL